MTNFEVVLSTLVAFSLLLLLSFLILLVFGKLDFIPRYVKRQLALPFFLKEDEGE